MDNYNLLIHLCLHLHKHNVVLEHVQFTSFADITNLLFGVESQKSKVESQEEKEKLNRHETLRKSLDNKDSLMGLAGFVWEEFIAKCKAYNCEEPVFKYLLLCREYFNAPLPDYLYEAYKHTFTDEDRDLFYKHLTGFDFAAQRDMSKVGITSTTKINV